MQISSQPKHGNTCFSSPPFHMHTLIMEMEER